VGDQKQKEKAMQKQEKRGGPLFRTTVCRHNIATMKDSTSPQARFSSSSFSSSPVTSFNVLLELCRVLHCSLSWAVPAQTKIVGLGPAQSKRF
jgi:hypothetical protein